MRRSAGVTLLEMLVVVSIIAAMAGVAYIPLTAGLDSLRLSSSATTCAAFFTSALTRAERTQEVVEIAIFEKEGTLRMRSTAPGFERKAELGKGVKINAVLPALEQQEDGPRLFYLYPGGSVPRIGIELANARQRRVLVRVDPITGVPKVEKQ